MHDFTDQARNGPGSEKRQNKVVSAGRLASRNTVGKEPLTKRIARNVGRVKGCSSASMQASSGKFTPARKDPNMDDQ